MVRLTAHYDGKSIIPDEPVELPKGVPLHVTIQPCDPPGVRGRIPTLSGLGKEVWAEVDPVAYQRREREGWE